MDLADYKHILEGKGSLNRWNDKDFLIESLHHSGWCIGYVTCEKRRYLLCGVSYGIVDVGSHNAVMCQS